MVYIYIYIYIYIINGYVAILKNRKDIVEILLLEKGANVNSQNIN